MSKPQKMLAVDIYTAEWQQVISSKIGHVYVPLAAKLDFEDVFNGTPPCLLDYLMTAGDGRPAIVEHVVYVFKKGARSPSDGRVVDYFNKRKVTSMEKHVPTPDQPFQADQENVYISESWRKVQEPDSFSVEEDGELSDTPSLRWGESSASDEEPTVDEDARERELSRGFRLITLDGKKDITRKLGGRLGEERYVAFTSARHNQVSVYWNKREREREADVRTCALVCFGSSISGARGPRFYFNLAE